MYFLNSFKKHKDLIHGISEREDGNMSFKYGGDQEVFRNRNGFLGKLKISPEDCVAMSVQHGTEVQDVDNSFRGGGMGMLNDALEVDALVTKEKGLFLFLLTADCLPVILYDPNKGVLGLAHLGWQNAIKSFSEKVIAVLTRKYGCDTKDLIVGIGPAIHKESYKFKDPIQDDMPEWKDFLTDLPDRQTCIDLIGFNEKQFIEAGVLEKNIEVSDIDTGSSSRFFSHYRSERTNEPEGRFVTVVGMT